VLALGKAERWNFCSHLLKLKNTSPRSIARDAEEGRAPRAGTASDAARRNLKKLFVLEENDMTFRPLHDRILVRRIEAEEKTAGGIIIPDTAKEKPQEGEVIAVGPRRPRRERQAGRTRREGRRPHPVRQMVRHRDQAERRGPADHEGKRRDGRDRCRRVAFKKAA
jgi:hypothetical protein